MRTEHLIDQLSRTPAALEALLARLDRERAIWRPPDGAWSVLEIACHLLDEERRDFRPRLEATLAEPMRAWEPIDPEAWAAADAYLTHDLDTTIEAFAAERARSLAWLRTCARADWGRVYRHPRGDLSAGGLLGAWAAHDALHLRQIGKRFVQLAERDAGPGVGYAGAL